MLLAAVLAALSFGGYRALTDGRFRRPRSEPTVWDEVIQAVPGARAGERATLLQFSSAFCAPCRATRRTLGDVAGLVPGVVHLEVDAEQHLALVRRLDILRTPTTLVLDSTGREVSRAAGAPRKEQVLSAVARLAG